MIKYAFVITCGVIVGGLLVEYKDYLTQQVPVPVAVLPDGGVYEGELRKGQLGGAGRLVWPDQSYYEGEFRDGVFEGKGVLHTSTYVYEGDFTQGSATGEGSIHYLDGSQYQGQVVHGIPDGQGVLETIAGDVYKGEFKLGLYHGQGELLLANGDRYVGTFAKGVFDGDGVYTRTRSALEDEKEMAEDELSNPTIYSGVFVDGQLTGQGVWIQGEQRYEGTFKDWLFEGEGIYSDPNGTYEGAFNNNEFEGRGVYTGTNGDRYEGDFIRGRFDGRGVHANAEGDVYRGGFKYGQRHGKGVLTYAEPLDDIAEVKGEWQYGMLVEANYPRLATPLSELTEYALYQQTQLLEKSLSTLVAENPEEIDLFFVGIAGDGSQEVFRREIEFIQPLFDEHYETAGKSVSLINSRWTYDQVPLATTTSIRKTLKAVADKMDKDEDILFVYLTSHGSQDHQFYLSQPGLSLGALSAQVLGEILEELPVRHKVVVISACYSGGFVEPIKDNFMMVITSASADKASFGCSDRSKMTYFGEAFFKDALLKSDSFEGTFYRARDIVRGREAKEGFEHSNPLIFKPKAIVSQLQQWRTQLQNKKSQQALSLLPSTANE